MYNILVITSSLPERIEYRVAALLHKKLNSTKQRAKLASIYLNNKLSGKRFIAACLLCLKSDVVIVHSPLTLSTPFILISWLSNKKILGIVWDVYPWNLYGKRVHKTLATRIIDFLEPLMFRSCSHTIVPTKDFAQSTALKYSHVIPFWPKDVYYSSLSTPKTSAVTHSATVKIVFAGQMNETRDIEAAYETLCRIAGFPFELIVFSDDDLPGQLTRQSNVTNFSSVDRASLIHAMRCCDLGLISLSPRFDAPAFPSKVFDYLLSDIPSLYHGPFLPEYTALLESTGIGIDITSRDCLAIADINLLRLNYDSKKEHFHSVACLSSGSLCSLADLIDSSR